MFKLQKFWTADTIFQKNLSIICHFRLQHAGLGGGEVRLNLYTQCSKKTDLHAKNIHHSWSLSLSFWTSDVVVDQKLIRCFIRFYKVLLIRHQIVEYLINLWWPKGQPHWLKSYFFSLCFRKIALFWNFREVCYR